MLGLDFKPLTNHERLTLQLHTIHAHTKEEDALHREEIRKNVADKWEHTLAFIDKVRETYTPTEHFDDQRIRMQKQVIEACKPPVRIPVTIGGRIRGWFNGSSIEVEQAVEA